MTWVHLCSDITHTVVCCAERSNVFSLPYRISFCSVMTVIEAITCTVSTHPCLNLQRVSWADQRDSVVLRRKTKVIYLKRLNLWSKSKTLRGCCFEAELRSKNSHKGCTRDRVVCAHATYAANIGLNPGQWSFAACHTENKRIVINGVLSNTSLHIY